MRARDFITELGDAPYNYKLDKDASDPGSEWYFHAPTSVGGLMVMFNYHLGQLSIEFTLDGEYEQSNKGDQFKILSTVYNIIKRELPKIVANTDIDSVIFTANAENAARVKLYRRIAPQISKILGPEWKFEERSNFAMTIAFIWRREQQ